MDLVFESELDWDRLLCQIEGDLEAGFTYRSVASDVETYWLLPIECTSGGTNPASFSCDSGFDCSSMNVCSIFLRVVGVSVGVVRVGTPEFRPSSVMN